MIVFLAGGVSGNLKPAWQRVAKRPDASLKAFEEELVNENFWRGESRHWIQDETSPLKNKNESIHGREHDIPQIHRSDIIRGGDFGEVINDDAILGGRDTIQREEKYRGGFNKAITEHRPYILESFYYADADTERLLPLFGDFLLDSGAFTFMQDNTSHLIWDEYIERYADFINRNKIEKFFELDIDSVVGYEQVKKFRRKLENLTGRQCIPVWHKSRGIKDYLRECDEYSYIAIGGIAIKEIKPEQYSAFPSMISEAHKRKCKVHGLGFTSLKYLPKIHFDSVDSTAWTTGNRFGYIYKFDGKTMQKIDCPKGKRLGDPRKIALINYKEWIKFQKYAEENL